MFGLRHRQRTSRDRRKLRVEMGGCLTRLWKLAAQRGMILDEMVLILMDSDGTADLRIADLLVGRRVLGYGGPR